MKRLLKIKPLLALLLAIMLVTSCSDGDYDLKPNAGSMADAQPDAYGRLPDDPLYGADAYNHLPGDPLYGTDEFGRKPDNPLYGADEHDKLPDDPHYGMIPDNYGHYSDEPEYLDENKYKYAMRWLVDSGETIGNTYEEMLKIPLEENKTYKLKGKIGDEDVTGMTIVLSKTKEDNVLLEDVNVSVPSTYWYNSEEYHTAEVYQSKIYVNKTNYSIYIGSGKIIMMSTSGKCYEKDRKIEYAIYGRDYHYINRYKEYKTSACKNAMNRINECKELYENMGKIDKKIDCYILSDEEFGKKEEIPTPEEGS